MRRTTKKSQLFVCIHAIMKPMLLILTVAFSVSVLPALMAAPYDDRSATLAKALSEFCRNNPCTPVGCGPWTPERERYCRQLHVNRPQYGVKEQSGYAGRLQQLLPRYNIKLGDYDEIIKKEPQQETLLDKLLKSGNYAKSGLIGIKDTQTQI